MIDNKNEIKDILLIGCSGFLGKCIIYLLLTQTNHNLCIVIRPKNGISINNRLSNILMDFNLTDNYSKRIKLIKINTEKLFNL